MNSLITSADQLNWIKPNKLPADDYRRIDTEGAYALAVIDDEVRVTMDRVFNEVRFTSDDPGEWTDIEAVLPRRLWPAQVWAGSKWAGRERPTYPAIDAAIAAALADYEADSE